MPFLIGTLSFLMLAVSLFMILLVLIQRGRGGGLAGAFGGMGGQSAFGTRAGDMFTRITIVLAVVWVLLAGGLGMMMRRDAEASKTGKNSVFLEGSKSAVDASKIDDTEKPDTTGLAPEDAEKASAPGNLDAAQKPDAAEKSNPPETPDADQSPPTPEANASDAKASEPGSEPNP